MTVGEIIEAYRKSHNLSQREFANLCGVSNSYISLLEKGINPKTNKPIVPQLDQLKKISNCMGMSVHELLVRSDSLAIDISAQGDFTPNTTEDVVTFEILGDVAAGYDHIATSDWEGEHIDVPLAWLHGHPASDFFCLRVKGDSMYPIYQDGDVVLVKRQSTLNRSGEIGVVVYNDELATLKKVEYVMGEDWFKMIPINPAFPPVTIEGEELEHCRVLGLPVKLIRDIKQ